MARSRAASKSTKTRRRSLENLSTLSEEVLRLRLQAFNLTITRRKAELMLRLKATTHPRIGATPCPNTSVKRVQADKNRLAKRATRTVPVEPTDEEDSDHEPPSDDSEAEPLDEFFAGDEPLALDIEGEQSLGQPSTANFTPNQLATIESTVKASFDRTLQSYSFAANSPFLGATPQYPGLQIGHLETPPRMAFTDTWIEVRRTQVYGVSTLIHCFAPRFTRSAPGP